MARETWVQSKVESYQRFKKWYLMLPCLTLSIIRCVSRVKWSNPGKGVAPSPTPQCSSYWKGSLWVTLSYGRQLYFIYIDRYLYVYVWKSESPSVMAKVVDYDLEVSEFKLQWCYYIHFWTKGKDINPFIPPTHQI